MILSAAQISADLLSCEMRGCIRTASVWIGGRDVRLACMMALNSEVIVKLSKGGQFNLPRKVSAVVIAKMSQAC